MKNQPVTTSASVHPLFLQVEYEKVRLVHEYIDVGSVRSDVHRRYLPIHRSEVTIDVSDITDGIPEEPCQDNEGSLSTVLQCSHHYFDDLIGGQVMVRCIEQVPTSSEREVHLTLRKSDTRLVVVGYRLRLQLMEVRKPHNIHVSRDHNSL
jgi:hypothetical protein